MELPGLSPIRRFGPALASCLLAASQCLAQDGGEVWEGVASPWRDGVHYVGIAGGALAMLALVLGVIIYVGPRLPGKKLASALRRRFRTAHIACGMAGASLALVHHVGRLVQAQEFGFALNAPALCGYAFVLVLLSGLLRAWTPRAWRKHWRVLAFIHRVSVVTALYFLFVHALHQAREFGGDSR